jgi:hypothetical protein
MLGLEGEPELPLEVRFYEKILVLSGLLLVFFEPLIVRLARRTGVEWWWRYVPFPFRGLAYAALVLFVEVFGGFTQKFIYFDF